MVTAVRPDGHLHVAFASERAELREWEAHLAGHAVVVESRMDWPDACQSICFHDPDDHLLELATLGLWQGYQRPQRIAPHHRLGRLDEFRQESAPLAMVLSL